MITHIPQFAKCNYLKIIACLTLTACDSSPTPSQNLDMTPTVEDMDSSDLGDVDQNVAMDQMLDTAQDQSLSDERDQMAEEETDQMLSTENIESIWSELRENIDQAQVSELVVIMGDRSGIRFVHEKDSSQARAVPIASASKLITALLALKLVDEGTVSLSDHPQQYLDWWTDDPTDPRSTVTLEQLLAFTSGFSGNTGLGDSEGIPCVEDANSNLTDCAQTIYDDFFSYEPGESYYYGPAHMHIAAAMLVAATGESWGDLFRRLMYEPLGMSRLTAYQLPSTDNPRASGGLLASPQNYAKILTALVKSELISEDSMQELTRDRTPVGTQFVTVPSTADDYGDWHYALGCWRECSETEYSAVCDEPGIISSPGAFGFYPWFDQKTGYWGIISTMIRVRGASVTVPLGHTWYARAKQALDLLNQ